MHFSTYNNEHEENVAKESIIQKQEVPRKFEQETQEAIRKIHKIPHVELTKSSHIKEHLDDYFQSISQYEIQIEEDWSQFINEEVIQPLKDDV